MIYPRLSTGFGTVVFFANSGLTELQVRYERNNLRLTLDHQGEMKREIVPKRFLKDHTCHISDKVHELSLSS